MEWQLCGLVSSQKYLVGHCDGPWPGSCRALLTFLTGIYQSTPLVLRSLQGKARKTSSAPRGLAGNRIPVFLKKGLFVLGRKFSLITPSSSSLSLEENAIVERWTELAHHNLVLKVLRRFIFVDFQYAWRVLYFSGGTKHTHIGIYIPHFSVFT